MTTFLIISSFLFGSFMGYKAREEETLLMDRDKVTVERALMDKDIDN